MHIAQTLMAIGEALEKRASGILSMVGGLSYAEFQILDALSQAPQSALTRIALAERVGLTPSGVSRALKPMEKIGLVTSIKAERDARQSLAQLTPAGQEAHDNAHAALVDTWSALPQAPAKQEALEAYLLSLTAPRALDIQYKEKAAWLAKS